MINKTIIKWATDWADILDVAFPGSTDTSLFKNLLSPKSFKLNGSTSKKIDTSDIDKKLEEVLKNITSHFQA